MILLVLTVLERCWHATGGQRRGSPWDTLFGFDGNKRFPLANGIPDLFSATGRHGASVHAENPSSGTFTSQIMALPLLQPERCRGGSHDFLDTGSRIAAMEPLHGIGVKSPPTLLTGHSRKSIPLSARRAAISPPNPPNVGAARVHRSLPGFVFSTERRMIFLIEGLQGARVDDLQTLTPFSARHLRGLQGAANHGPERE